MGTRLRRWLVCTVVAVMAANAVVSAALAAHGHHALHQDPRGLHAGHDHPAGGAGMPPKTGGAGMSDRPGGTHYTHAHHKHDDLAQHVNPADASRDAAPAGDSAAPGGSSPADPDRSGSAPDTCCQMYAPCCHPLALLADVETVGWPAADGIKRGPRVAAVPPGRMTSPPLRPPRRLA